MNACRHEGMVNAKVLTTVTKPMIDASQINEKKKKGEHLFSSYGVSDSVLYTLHKLSYLILCCQTINLNLKLKKSRLRGPKTKSISVAS